jgi:hypothetical protein
MPLILLGSNLAMEMCTGDLKGPVNSPPYTSLATDLELRKYLYEVSAWASASPTARAILATVQSSFVDIYVVGMKGGGFSCFNSDYPREGVGTVYYDLTIKMEVGFPGPGPTETASTFKVGPKRNVSLHSYIGFLHELGHAKQFLENPGFFREVTANITKATWVNRTGSKGPVALGGGSGAFQSDPKFRFEIETAAKKMYEKKRPNAHKGLQLTNVRMTKPQWGVRIETDNLNRHEWPMCDELGYPKRNYTDLVVTGY